MKLGLNIGIGAAQVQVPMQLLQRAEALGFDSAWTAEAYGSDAVTPATWMLAQTTRIKVGTAIMQMPARSPAITAMTAATLDQLSGGRFILGLGPSGPQVAEGWHGVAYGKPLTRTREYIQIIREIWRRERPLEFDGEYYQVPYHGDGASGLGKPLKSILHGNPEIPIYTASISKAGLRCAGEVADGVFPLWMNPERFELIGDHVAEGLAKAGGGRDLKSFAVCPGVLVSMGDDIARCQMPARAQLALYVGGMGSRTKNFYNDYAKRLGYEAAAAEIQDLFLAGKKQEAMAAVPDAMIDDLFLVGSRERIIERLQRWKDAGARGEVHTLCVSSSQPEVLELLAEELL
jgi:F420-dependent oxidoreductase-like protein